MGTFTFHGMSFAREEEGLRCRLFSRYSFLIPWEELSLLGECTVAGDSVSFTASEKKVRHKMGRLVREGVQHRLVHQLHKKPAVYITAESGIPLIGANEFGIVDRGSNILEVKPLTGCNFNCIYCSVDEGRNAKTHDYLVEEEYLVAVAAAVAETKRHPVEFNIGPQGEPLLYPEIVQLVRDLAAIPQTGIISLNTNGSLLSRQLIDELAAAGLTRINLSLPALDAKLAAKLAGIPVFPLQHLLEMLEYGKEKLSFLLAPVVVPGWNEGEMEKIVRLSTTIRSEFPTIGIQNYLEYPRGRRPVKQRSWEWFFSFIRDLEARTGVSLTATKEDFCIAEEDELPKPFRKGQTVEALVVMPGRYPGELVGAAQGRAITIKLSRGRTAHIGQRVRVRLVRDKHNIFKAVL